MLTEPIFTLKLKTAQRKVVDQHKIILFRRNTRALFINDLSITPSFHPHYLLFGKKFFLTNKFIWYRIIFGKKIFVFERIRFGGINLYLM